MLGPRPSHTHYMVPFAPLGRCPCSVKPRPCVIPDVTCIILVHTTNTADKITTTPLLDSTLSPCPPPVDHRGDPLSHTFNIDQDIYLPHICCIQHRLGYLPVSDSSLSDSSLSNSFFLSDCPFSNNIHSTVDASSAPSCVPFRPTVL